MMDDEVLDMLRIIAEDVRAIRLAVERERPRRRQNLGVDLGEHLRAISAVVGDRVFSVAELLAHAAIPEGEALRSAIIALTGALNGKRLGKLLRSIEGQEIAGLRVERIGVDRLGAIWALRVSLPQTRTACGATLNLRGV